MLKKKKKKSLFDARTKAYKEHKTKLEAARLKREAKKSKFTEKIQESISEFNRESFLVEDNLDVLRDIVKRKQNKSIKFKDGSMKVDLFTANALVQVMDKVNADNKAKLTKMINGNKKQFMAAASAVMKMVKMR